MGRARHDVQARLDAVFGRDIEIVDSKEPLRMQPIRKDCVGADPKAPDNCILVHTAQRMFGAKAAVFWKAWAYVDLIDPRKPGVRLVYRFRLSNGAMRHIRDLDTGKPFREGTAIILQAVTPTQTREFKRAKDKKWRRTPSGKTIMRLNTARGSLKRAEAQYDRAVEQFEDITEHAKPGSPKLDEVREQRKVARKTLQTWRDKVADLTEKTAAIRTRGNPSPRKAYRFDLSTRNGAAQHYNFVNGA